MECMRCKKTLYEKSPASSLCNPCWDFLYKKYGTKTQGPYEALKLEIKNNFKNKLKEFFYGRS